MFKKLLLLASIFILGVQLLTAAQPQITVTYAPPTNIIAQVTNYNLYISTNAFTNILSQTAIGTNGTVTTNVNYGVATSLYFTAVDTNGLETLPSNELRTQPFQVLFGKPNALALLGGTNWTGATVVTAPSNGTLTGTPPNVTYTPTNASATKDMVVYTLPNEIAYGSPITNYYALKFVFPNSPPTAVGITYIGF